MGAYHFFSYDSPGRTQAENFIATVGKAEGMLPPVVDIEFYGDKEKHPPKREDVEAILTEMLRYLEAYYDRKPILYATQKSYRLYIEDSYEGYDIWIRNVLSRPDLPDGRKWTFWQYSHREKLDGYAGQEEDIDMNVFNGTAEAFDAYAKK